MSQSAKKRPSMVKTLGGIVGAILLCIVPLLIWASIAGDRKFARMQEMAKSKLDEVKGLDPRRPSIRGGTEPGNAWDDYALAIAEVKTFADAKKLGEVVRRTPQADPEVAKAALAGHGAAADHVRRGAGRASSRYPYEWERGLSMPLPGLMDAQNVAHLLVLKARALVEERKSKEAAEILLDVCQFGRDMGADGVILSEMIGMSIMNLALTEIRDHLASGTGRFDWPGSKELARGLGVLDGILPRHDRALLNEALLLAGVMDESVVGSWGPQRILYADAIERTSDWMTRAGKAETLPWAEAQKQFEAIEAEVKRTWNPISQISVPGLTKISRVCRERRAQVRIARIASHFMTTGEVLDQEDPFGAKIKSTRAGDALKIWSVGADGIDDGGSGDWKGETKDIVLEVKK